MDLHTHTVRSDGTTTPATNVALAAAAGLGGLAITDHDTTAGWSEAAAAAERHGIEFVGGIELSTELAGLSVHVLGYWVDPHHPPLVAECGRLRNERRVRAEEIVRRLAGMGIAVDFQRVLARAGTAPLGRPHIAAELVAAGIVGDMDEAFSQYLADGGPAYVPKHALSPADGVRLLRAAGGVAVLAHPGAGDRQAPVTEELAADLVACGLRGIEVDHPSHDAPTAQRWRRIAAGLGVAATGSSDFHGTHKDVKIGGGCTPGAVVDDLRSHVAVAG